MSRRRSFITLLCLSISLAVPLADDDDDDDDGCESDTIVHVPDSPSAAILAPYQHPPTPHPSPSQLPHATLPVHHPSKTPAILGTVFGIVIAIVALALTARYLVRRHRIAADPFKDPPKPRFTAFRLRRITALARPRAASVYLPTTQARPRHHPSLHTYRHRVWAPSRVCKRRSGIHDARPACARPSPVYIPPFSPSPSLTSSSSLSPAPSTEPLSSPSPNTARLSRLLSSTFRDSRVAMSPARPTTAHLIQTARSYAHAYRPSSAITTSLYTPPTPSARLSGTRCRIGFYPGPTDDAHAAWGRFRDTFSTVTTSDTETAFTVPHLHRAMADVQPSISPFADPDPGNGNEQPTTQGHVETQTPMGTPLGLTLRLSDASEHAQYRLRERERERQRLERERERAEQRLSTESQTSESTTSMETMYHRRSQSLEVEEMRKEFKLRDSESVLREIGW
ncbi:hypothetical protein JVT61DRAFT_8198 [Boletus reticuloceps]|uniref:Uncharacterized protein n=1 Tax=Boletus reticuloceps TaxID=495285 RepID=A0A8I2YYK5_9AGAM|nr:hypothetical protein JVT61DRAFT_8198 [Boletus reticuloceps]